jgi:hypothetical protein
MTPPETASHGNVTVLVLPLSLSCGGATGAGAGSSAAMIARLGGAAEEELEASPRG